MARLSAHQLSRRAWLLASAAAALAVLLAYGLRAYAVGASPWRGDEGFAVTFVSQPLSQMMTAMGSTEPNPPLYWLVLKGWMALAGRSELASRWPSVLAGVVTVALTYRLGRALVSPTIGLMAALLTACSPLLVWYGQDARVYSLVTMLVLAATWQTWVAAHHRAWGYWLAAGALWWLAMFAHYFAVLPFASVGLGLALSPGTRRAWRPALVAGLATGLAYLPWAIYVAPLMLGHSKGWIVPSSVADVFWRTLEAFSVGTLAIGADASWQWLGGVLLAGLCVLGGVAVARRSATAFTWLAALGLGGPLFLGLISLARPVYTEQYAMPALPGILLMAAAALGIGSGARKILRPVAGSALAGLTLLTLLSLTNVYFNPRYAKSHDWRAVVAYLVQTARPAEVVAINLPDPAFYLYYHGPMPVETVPAAPMEQLGTAAAEAQLEKLRDNYQHIRFFFSPSPGYDPDGFAGQWLENCCEKMTDTFISGLRVQTFDTPSGSLAARQPDPVDFAEGVSLTGYRLAESEIVAGDTVHLTLFWTAREPVKRAYTVFVHFLAPDGFDLLNGDSPPVNGRRPTDGWSVGETIIDPHLISIPADTPPGDYTLEIGLYLLSTLERLPRTDNAGQFTDRERLPLVVHVRAP